MVFVRFHGEEETEEEDQLIYVTFWSRDNGCFNVIELIWPLKFCSKRVLCKRTLIYITKIGRAVGTG